MGNEIIIGKYYGYSQTINGNNNIKIGKAIKHTPKGLLTLEIISAKTSVYNDELYDVNFSKTITCKPVLLFPVIKKNIKFSDEKLSVFKCKKCNDTGRVPFHRFGMVSKACDCTSNI